MEKAAQSELNNINQTQEGMTVLMDKIKELENNLKKSEKDKEWLRWSNSQLHKKLVDLEERHSILLRRNRYVSSKSTRDIHIVENTNVPEIPLEMWENVFDKVEDSQSWLNLYRASNSFEDLLHEKRTSALLPEVLQLLLRQKLITIKDIFSCRLVSPEWKEKATKAFKIHLISEEDPAANSLDGFWTNIPGRVELHDLNSIQRFLQDMRNHQGNPFVGRNVSFKSESQHEDEGESYDEFWRLGISFLEKYGKYIDNFQFASLPIEDGQIKFRECLRLIPQITGLNIFGESDLPEDEDLQTYSLPGLDNLERLNLLEVPIPLMRKIFQELCSSPERLKHLFIYVWENSTVTEILPRFSNLETILIIMKSSDLERFRELRFPLRKIQISQLFKEEDFLETVFTSCMSFSDTLVNLYVDYTSVPGKKHFPIYLPQLNHLELQLNEYFEDDHDLGLLPFSLHASDNLETGNIQDEQKEESCIWKLLPKLDTFIYQEKHFNRPTNE